MLTEAQRLRPSHKFGRLARFVAWALSFLGVVVFAWLLLGFVPYTDPLANFDFSTVVTDRHGQILRISLTKDHKYRIRMHLDDLPAFALEHVLTYEDRWFWWHVGVNPLSLGRACLTMLSGGRRLGGSTITMQTVRLAYKIHSKTILGKLRQMFLALVLERHISKAEILEAYFNLAPYGGNVEGLAAAAQVYFHKDVSKLTVAELEALLLVPQNPLQRKPATDNEYLRAACKRQWYKDNEYAPIRFFKVQDLPFKAPHLTTELLALRGEDTPHVMRTTIDFAKQRLLEQIITRYIARRTNYGINNASALLVHWPTMEVRALVGSADFFNKHIEGQIDGTRARRSPGSTLKPFIYALALEQGLIHPLSILADTPRSFRGYDPENFDHGFQGPIQAARALRASRNVPALNLAGRLKNPDLYTFLQEAGVQFLASADHYGLALVLGGAEVTMRELATLYAMLANDGLVQPLKFVPDKRPGPARSLLKPATTFVTLSMLYDEGPDYIAKTRTGRNLPLRFKTGTSTGFRDAWCCGIVGPYVLVVWVGNFNNHANPLFVGGWTAKPLYLDVARALAGAEDLRDSFLTPRHGLDVEKIQVCRNTGDLDTSLCTETAETWFIPGVSPVKPTGILRRIQINTATGLRPCIPTEEGTEQVVWEFWPSDLAKMFKDAGLPKPPPPPFEEACRKPVVGQVPKITRPKQGLTFYVSLKGPGTTPLLLSAQGDAECGQLNWFINGRFLGSNLPGENLLFEAIPGKYQIMVSDNLERTTTQTIIVKSVP